MFGIRYKGGHDVVNNLYYIDSSATSSIDCPPIHIRARENILNVMRISLMRIAPNILYLCIETLYKEVCNFDPPFLLLPRLFPLSDSRIILTSLIIRY